MNLVPTFWTSLWPTCCVCWSLTRSSRNLNDETAALGESQPGCDCGPEQQLQGVWDGSGLKASGGEGLVLVALWLKFGVCFGGLGVALLGSPESLRKSFIYVAAIFQDSKL